MHRTILIGAFTWALTAGTAAAQLTPHYQTDFPPDELAQRRAQVMDAIGADALALLQGAAAAPGFVVFRQSNEFYYLTGLEVPHSYLLLDGQTRRSTLFLPHRDEARERGEGKTLSAEDAELVAKLTGVDQVLGIEKLGRQLYRKLLRPPAPALYTFFSPAEGEAQSRDELLIGFADSIADPWDGRPSREGHFRHLLQTRYPQLELRDLTPVLDRMRIVKSPREVELIRRASQLAGEALLEAMRSTEPGLFEYQLDAAARYVFLVNGARGEGYRSITASGGHAYFGHYYRNDGRLRAGDLVLMDYAPDYRYYTSDVARMWPVSGAFGPRQLQLYGFIVRYHQALMKRIRPGVTADQILDEAAAEMRQVWEETEFSDPAHRAAAQAALDFRGHLSHPVGMAVHDVGSYRGRPLEPGQVFSVDPMLWVHEQRIYMRVEDVVVVTETGVENFTGFVPTGPAEIEAIVRQPGLLQKVPPLRETP